MRANCQWGRLRPFPPGRQPAPVDRSIEFRSRPCQRSQCLASGNHSMPFMYILRKGMSFTSSQWCNFNMSGYQVNNTFIGVFVP